MTQILNQNVSHIPHVADKKRHRMKVVTTFCELKSAFGKDAKSAQSQMWRGEFFSVMDNGETELVQCVRMRTLYVGGKPEIVR